MTQRSAPSLSIGLLLLSLAWPPTPARARPPSPAMLKAREARLAKRAVVIVQAYRWRKTLRKALRPRTAAQRSIHQQLFLSTYKHYRPKTHSDAKLRAWAGDIARAWKRLQKRAKRARLKPSLLAWAIYQLTNSDWEPVICATGPGRDKLRTGKQLTAWGRALIALGRRAQGAKLSPVNVWTRIARSKRVSTVAEVRRVNVRRLPPAPMW